MVPDLIGKKYSGTSSCTPTTAGIDPQAAIAALGLEA